MTFVKSLVSVCVASAFAFVALPASAQDLKEERETNVSWHMIEMTKFHNGKRARAAEIVKEYFAPADRDIGGTVMDVHLNTGDWDFITMFPMPGGPADVSWITSPADVKWMKALNKRTGGAEATKRLTDEWDTLVAKRERHVAHVHK